MMRLANVAIQDDPDASPTRTPRAADDDNGDSFGDHLATQRARKAKKPDELAHDEATIPPLPPPPAIEAKPTALAPISQTSPASALIAASFGRALAAIVNNAAPTPAAPAPAADPQVATPAPPTTANAPATPTPAKPTAPNPGDADPAATDIAAIAQAAIAQSDAQPAAPALTPLEQALHDLLEQLHDRREQPSQGSEPPAPHAATASPAPHAVVAVDAVPVRDVRSTPAAAPAAAVREMRELPEPNANPSHLHLVLGDDSDRVVVTVAVRGNDVNIAVRGNDEMTAAALARNAGVLEHAMRARGLDLSSFSAERDHDHSKRNRDQDRDQEHRDDQSEPFRLEELP